MIDADACLVALCDRFERHAAQADKYYQSGCTGTSPEYVEEVCLAATERALVEAAASVRHRTSIGRDAKERMLAHLNRWAETTTAERPWDSDCYGDRLAWSLQRSAI